ncbi:MAG: hypothetical protein J7647_17385 [Cyanobacteria bacterium SBLK]|nr:hypothetical protein [Cyanobacteria bacterium SBLK]
MPKDNCLHFRGKEVKQSSCKGFNIGDRDGFSCLSFFIKNVCNSDSARSALSFSRLALAFSRSFSCSLAIALLDDLDIIHKAIAKRNFSDKEFVELARCQFPIVKPTLISN